MPEPVSHETPRPMQKSNPVPDDVRPYVPPQVVPLGGTGAVGGGTLPAIGDLGGLTDLRPLPPPRDPLFVRATQDPRFANAFHPPYPPSLVRQGLEGSVTVRVTIDETGRVTACDLVKATNRAFYDETRDQALRYWRFRPATSDGAPVRSEQTLTVTFRLEDI
ncbi:MAG: TonB family protein [Lacunisphaera sp.]